jgi:hypothetical protein
MTPKEKAEELIQKFMKYTPTDLGYYPASECAKIAVDELITEVILLHDSILNESTLLFWMEVKRNIDEL